MPNGDALSSAIGNKHFVDVSLSTYNDVISNCVAEIANSYHLKVIQKNGDILSVPCSFQINERGFRPFKGGKASPEELQKELDNIIAAAKMQGETINTDSTDVVRMLLSRHGIGTDCSGFVYRAQKHIHHRLGMNYDDKIFRSTNELTWMPNSPSFKLSVGDISYITGKDPARLAGSDCMTAEDVSAIVDSEIVLPGDVVIFKRLGELAVNHVAIVSDVKNEEGNMKADIWHSIYAKRLTSGIRKDKMVLKNKLGRPEIISNNQDLLNDLFEYSFCRPLGLVAIRAALT